jgi:hypothetical protein
MSDDELFVFRKQPVQIKARRLDEPRTIETREGTMEADAGDWLIEGVEGERYFCQDSVFRDSYRAESMAAAREFAREVDGQ